MAATLTLPDAELAKFSEAMRTIVAVTGASAEEVTRGFAGRVLKKWAGKTKVIPEKIIVWRSRTRAAQVAGVYKPRIHGITVNTGRRGGDSGVVWYRTRKDKWQVAGHIVRDATTSASFVPAWLHFKTSEWGDINQAAGNYATQLQRILAHSLKAVGLARQSVIQIADALGINLSAVPGAGISTSGIVKARAAIASNGQRYVNGTGRAQWQAQRFFVELNNHYPPGVRIGMDATLAAVIGAEVKYYERNLANGVFLAHERVARAYPFLRVAA